MEQWAKPKYLPPWNFGPVWRGWREDSEARQESGNKKHTSKLHHEAGGEKCYGEQWSRKERTEWGLELDTVNRGVTEGFELEGDREASHGHKQREQPVQRPWGTTMFSSGTARRPAWLRGSEQWARWVGDAVENTQARPGPPWPASQGSFSGRLETISRLSVGVTLRELFVTARWWLSVEDALVGQPKQGQEGQWGDDCKSPGFVGGWDVRVWKRRESVMIPELLAWTGDEVAVFYGGETE